MDTPHDSARREAACIAAMTLVGGVLRFWNPAHLGLNHFDEGIYALAGTWSLSPKGLAAISPEVVSYSPPLYPILVGISYLFLGVSDVSAILVSILAGTLTIPAVGWVARRTFGPGAGAAASALIALSGPHIAFSRMALTDATFLLVWVLALGLGGRFLERPTLLRAIPFGLMVGLAQNAKYNGYLAGGIVALTALWGCVVPPRGGRSAAARAVGVGVVAAAVALVVYAPWYRFVEAQPGGYAGLIRHHRGYLSDASAWPSHWRMQMGLSYALSGEFVEGLTWGVVAWPIAWALGLFAAEWSSGRPPRREQMRRRLGLVLGAAVYGVAPSLAYWVALASLPWLLRDASPARRLLGVGWLVMAVLTPFYHPYPRLWLPLHAFGWIALSGLVVRREEEASTESPSEWSGRLRALALAAAILAAVVGDAVIEPRARSFGSPIGPTDGFRDACRQIAASMAAYHQNRGTPAGRVLVVARPPAVFYLTGQVEGRPVVRLPDVEAMAREVRPGDEGVLDSRGLNVRPSPEEIEFLNRAFRTGRMQFFRVLSPPGVSGDIDPWALFDRHRDLETELTYFPIVPPAPPLKPTGPAP